VTWEDLTITALIGVAIGLIRIVQNEIQLVRLRKRVDALEEKDKDKGTDGLH